MIQRFSYDPEVDSAYIQLENDPVLDSEEIADGIIVDYNDEDKIVAFELLDVKKINSDGFITLKSVLSPSTIAELQEFNMVSKQFC